MKKVKSVKCNLKAINDIYIIKEDPIDIAGDSASGLTKDVVKAIKGGKLYTPETAEFYVNKYPCTGEVLAKGDRTRQDIKVGDRVRVAPFGNVRTSHEGQEIMFVREHDILALV
jgi:co-chaperonin GroES (HSP10)